MVQVEFQHIPESPKSVFAVAEAQQEQGERKARKTVAFRLDESSFDKDEDCIFGKVRCFYGPPRPTLTPEEEQRLYWNKKHFKTFKKDCKKLARTTDEELHKVYIKTFMDVYSNPPDHESKVGIVHSRDVTCLPLATASVRGLERYIFPGLLQDQYRVKEAVIKAQGALPPEMLPRQRAFILESTSTILSRQHRHLARVVGHADSIVALSIYKSTFLPKNKKNKTASSSSASANTTSTGTSTITGSS